jgi:hypothetical protein
MWKSLTFNGTSQNTTMGFTTNEGVTEQILQKEKPTHYNLLKQTHPPTHTQTQHNTTQHNTL